MLSHKSLKYEVGAKVISILQMSKLRLGEINDGSQVTQLVSGRARIKARIQKLCTKF